MRILTICERLFPDTSGGPSLSIYHHNKYLTKNKVEVTTLTTALNIDKSISNRWILNEQGKVFYSPQLFHKYPFKLIVKAFKEVHIHDIIHVHSLFYPTSLLIAFYAWSLKKKVVWSIHGELDDACLKIKWFKKSIFLFVFKNLIGRMATFHAASDNEVLYIKKQIPVKKMIKIPALLELPNSPTNPIADKYFLYVGRFHEKKGLDVLMQGLKQSRFFNDSEFILKMAGNYKNSYGQKICNLINKYSLNHKIQLLGSVTEEIKSDLYASAYFTIMPSITENFGLVAAESLSFGTPVITTTGTPWQILIQNQCGFWVDCTVADLANSIDKAISLATDAYLAYRKNSKMVIKENFDIDQNISKWIKFYDSLYGSNPAE